MDIQTILRWIAIAIVLIVAVAVLSVILQVGAALIKIALKVLLVLLLIAIVLRFSRSRAPLRFGRSAGTDPSEGQART